jgi:hypothetical protein
MDYKKFVEKALPQERRCGSIGQFIPRQLKSMEYGKNKSSTLQHIID